MLGMVECKVRSVKKEVVRTCKKGAERYKKWLWLVGWGGSAPRGRLMSFPAETGSHEWRREGLLPAIAFMKGSEEKWK